jgi:signal transduction histidine kinase
MEDISRLNDAFKSFTQASKSLEVYYQKLEERVKYLTVELQKKNKELQSSLAQTQEVKDYLNAIVHSLRETVIVMDNDSKITMINGAAEKMLKINAKDIVGTEFASIDIRLQKEDNDMILTAGGVRYNVLLSTSEVLDSEGSIRGQVMLIQDITQIKDLESQQERNKRLIAMGEMAAKIVHEVRSPLCSIELNASMLANDLEGTVHNELARDISTGIKSLNNILTNMLYFAKPNKLSRSDVDINGIIEEMVYLMMPLIETNGIAINNNLSHAVHSNGDVQLLKQAFMNILLNAIQVTPEGGSIDISVHMVDGYSIVEVRDQGMGIEPENMERIFDPFFTTKDSGTGLGLSIASKIMQSHGGVIKVSSVVGVGSSFFLYYPLTVSCESHCLN